MAPGSHNRLRSFEMHHPPTAEELEEIKEDLQRLIEEVTDTSRTDDSLDPMDTDDPTIDDISGGHIPRDVREDEHNADDADTLDTSPERWGPVDANLSVTAYDTDRDESAYLCCSECGERIELVNSSDVFTVFSGGVCGCAEPPGEWRAEELHTTSDRA